MVKEDNRPLPEKERCGDGVSKGPTFEEAGNGSRKWRFLFERSSKRAHKKKGF